ncbi:hypothetical protein [Paenibacillus brasilensis]|uniref:Lipoprotein n=1 Tax=Paenibacillus brasilensis TaxID=128574 RepID=A0ABU0KYQ7_9BACL|nr:hypothetical protein [Paenibacillus brasilensis]MDQ0494585.1 hypothetical protein [Paenibacillus brasilensis]
MLTKKQIVWIVIVMACLIGLLLTLCIISNNSKSRPSKDLNHSINTLSEKIKLNTAEKGFVVIYSDAMKEGADLVSYSSTGDIIGKQKLKDGRAFYYFTKFDGNYYIASERQNRHYVMDNYGNIYSFFGPAKYNKDRAIGTSFIKSSGDYLFFTMNVGTNPQYSPKVYSNELVYSKMGESALHHVMLPGYFQSVVEKENKAYVLYIDGNGENVGIYVIDLNTNRLLHNYSIQNHKSQERAYYPVGQNNGSSLLWFHNRLIIMLDGNRPGIQDRPIIQILNPSDGSLDKEISISNESFSLYDTALHNGNLYVISNNGEIMAYDSSLKNVKKIQLKQNKEFIQKKETDRGYISSTRISGNSIDILYDFVKKSPKDRVREIRRYSLETGAEEAVIPLTYHSNKEMIRFFGTN